MSCSECAGRALVAACPMCAADEPETAPMEPMEAGCYARECCEPRESNPYADGKARAEWFEGWDGPDLEDGDDTAPDYDGDEITEPLDCMSLSTLARRLELFPKAAEMQWAILKHELRGMTAMPPEMDIYVRTLRWCHELQTQLKRRAA